VSEAVKVKVEGAKSKTRTFRDGSGVPLFHTAKINPFFEGVFRRYHGHQNPVRMIDPDGKEVVIEIGIVEIVTMGVMLEAASKGLQNWYDNNKDKIKQSISNFFSGSNSATPPNPQKPDNNEEKDSKGNKIRREPANEQEKAALKDAQSGKGQGKYTTIIKEMSDPKYKPEDGWVKNAYNDRNGTEIHYNENTQTGEKTDYKFINPPPKL
jgi:hypothetical protein